MAPEDYAGYRELRSALNMPIAAGENEHSLYGFRELLGQRCVDIAQPDIASAGGFTACRHIIALAQAHGIQVNPHVWGSAVSQAASLQLIAAIPVRITRSFRPSRSSSTTARTIRSASP